MKNIHLPRTPFRKNLFCSVGGTACYSLYTSLAGANVRDARSTSAVPEGFPPNEQIDNPVFREYPTMYCHRRLRSELDSHQAEPPDNRFLLPTNGAMLTLRGLRRKEAIVTRLFLLPHFGRQLSAVELETDRVADLDLGRVAQDGAGSVGGDGVAAFEDS